MQHEQWDEAKVADAAKTLDKNGSISLNETCSPKELDILDRHLFAARPDVLLYISPSSIEYKGACSAYGGEFVEALARMKNLRRLAIVVAPNHNLSALSALHDLTELKLHPRGNVAVDFTSGMTNLESLVMQSIIAIRGEKLGGFSSYDPISRCASLKSLAVVMVSKPDFGFAAQLPVETLRLYDVKGYQNEASLFGEHLKSLELTLMSSFGEDMSLLAGSPNLENLELNQSKNIKSLSGLADPSSLKRLSVFEMASLTDFSILRQAKNLRSINLSFISPKVDAKELCDILLSIDSLEEVSVGTFHSSRQWATFLKLFGASPKANILVKR